MKRILASTFVLNTIATAATAGPMLLTDTQMDHVTAGFVAVDVNAAAASFGPGSQTFTNTGASTRSFHTPNGWQIDLGVGHGTAIACCGTYNDTTVNTSAAVAGDKTFIYENHSESRSAFHSASRGRILAIAVTAPSGQEEQLNRIDLSGLSLRVMKRQ